MSIIIRQETPADYPVVFSIVEAAFKNMEYSDGTEQYLVERLRKSDAFIPELSLVAESAGEIIGHILLTKIRIKSGEDSYPSLSLAPVSVKPSHQGKGIGGQLIKQAHKVAQELGHQSVVLLGHASYYPRFGYEQTSKYGIQLPFEAPAANCMIIALEEGGLTGVTGMVEYPKAFFE